jgi:hypothetical protein
MDKINLQTQELQTYFYGVDTEIAKEKVIKIAEIIFTLIQAKHPELSYYNAYSSELVKDLYNLGNGEQITGEYVSQACHLLYLMVRGKKFIGQLNSDNNEFYINHYTKKMGGISQPPKAVNFINQVVEHFESGKKLTSISLEDAAKVITIPEIACIAGLDVSVKKVEEKIKQVLKILATQTLPLLPNDNSLFTLTTLERSLECLELCYPNKGWTKEFIQDILKIDALLIGPVFKRNSGELFDIEIEGIKLWEVYYKESLAFLVNKRYNDFLKFREAIISDK